MHAIAAAILLFVAVTVSNTGGTDAHFGSITNSGRCGAVTQDISAPFLLGTVAYAAETSGGDSGALVPCGNNIEVKEEGGKICTYNECSICHTSILAQRVLRFMVGIGSILCALLFVYAGGLYVFSGTKPGNVSKAHKVFTNALIGLVLVLAAWLIVDLLIKSFAKTSISGAWTTLLCDGASSKHCVDKLSAIEVNVEQTSGTSCESVHSGYCAKSGGCPTSGKDHEISGTSCSTRTDGKTSCCASYTSQKSCDLGSGKKGTCQTTTTCPSGIKTSPCSDDGFVCCDMASNIKQCSSFTHGFCVSAANSASRCTGVKQYGTSGQVTASFEIVGETTDCNSNADGDTLCCRKVMQTTTSGSSQGVTPYDSAKNSHASTISSLCSSSNDKAFESGDGSVTCMKMGSGAGVEKGVVTSLTALSSECGSGCVIVTSLDGGKHTNGSAHYAGTKSDLSNTTQLDNYIKNNWEQMSDRTGEYGGKQYYSDELDMTCVRESSHWDCCHGKTTKSACS